MNETPAHEKSKKPHFKPASRHHKPVTLENAADLAFDHYFTLAAGVSQRTVGEIEGGFRVDFDYGNPADAAAAITAVSNTAVLTKRLAPVDAVSVAIPRPSAGQNLVNAQIASGSDWVFVSNDGFVDLDSNITIALKDLPTQCLLGIQLAGRADLRDSRQENGDPVFRGDETSQQVIGRWRQGFGENSYIPLVLSVTIDVPVSGTNAAQTKIYQECAVLGRSLLLGIGRATLNKNSDIAKVTLVIGKVTSKNHV